MLTVVVYVQVVIVVGKVFFLLLLVWVQKNRQQNVIESGPTTK